MIIDYLSPDGLTPLWKKSQIESAFAEHRLPDWVQKSYEVFVEIIRQNDFPCFFGTVAEQKEMIRYTIAPSLTTPEAFNHILTSIYTYLEEERELTEHSTEEEDAIFLTLAIFFPLEEEENSLEHYANQAYAFFNELHQRDQVSWPADIPTDPRDPDWCYCLGGRSLFLNVCTPANHNRRSRNLGPGLTIVVNPQDLFEKAWELWGEDPRRNIFKRVEKYDSIPPCPLLGPWEPEEERHPPNAAITVLAENNEHQFFFPFHYYRLVPDKEGGCPAHPPSSK